MKDGIIRKENYVLLVKYNRASKNSASNAEENALLQSEMEIKRIVDEAKKIKTLPEILAMIEEEKNKKNPKP